MGRKIIQIFSIFSILLVDTVAGFDTRSIKYEKYPAQDQSSSISKSFVIAERLHANTVFNIFQDNFGAIWLAFWQRCWLISLVIVTLAGMVIGLYRYHLNKRLEIERIRCNIASDLHDEIGTSLSAIALMSEMLQQEIQRVAPELATRLKDISSMARQLEESIHDIVWAIRPGNDTLEDMVLCMKQFAAEMLEAKGIEFSFMAPIPEKKLHLAVHLRHQLYLIFKEAINNLVRYSAASQADIWLRSGTEMLTLSIRDNGKGFDQLKQTNGNGLGNMKKRAQAMNGILTINSTPGKGTTVALRMPV